MIDLLLEEDVNTPWQLEAQKLSTQGKASEEQNIIKNMYFFKRFNIKVITSELLVQLKTSIDRQPSPLLLF